PDDILGELKDYFNGNVRKNLLLTSELINILELLKKSDIGAISYKGPVLAHSAYGNISLRDFRDIDILIDKSDAVNVKRLMISNGYELYLPISIKDYLYLKLDSEYRFFNRKTGVMIEINWDFEGIFISFPMDPKFLFNELTKFHFNGMEIEELSPENQILMLSIHNAKHDWNRLLWICDISEFLKSYTNLNWSKILKNAKKIGIKRILLINLFLAKDLFQLNLPNEVLNELESDSKALEITNDIKRRLLIENKSLNLFEKFIFDIKKRDKIRYGLKDSFSGLFKPSYADFQLLPLPENLFFLYYLIRPFLVFKRYNKFKLTKL
ncbi:MAG: nucleotidyltransferase family protein, partial [Methanobacteriaceae archaeon]|nr:nucleotidyltransferase family protein [Methanobacteriaceae archaeon]